MCKFCGYPCESWVTICPNCGQPTEAYLHMVYCKSQRAKFFWRIGFVLTELCSFSAALFLCWLFAQVLDTDVFEVHSYLIFVVWLWVVYKIYRAFEPRLR